MDRDQFRAAAHSAIDHIIDYYDTLPDRRVVADVQPGYLAPLLPSGPPATGEPWEQIQADIESKILPGITHWQSPNFLAFFPANATYPSILGELYSAAFTSANFSWVCSPAATELETVVLDWLCTLLGLPDCYLSTSAAGGGGVLQGSASEAVVTAMVAARERYLAAATADIADEAEKQARRDEIAPRLVAVVPDQAHSSTTKGSLIIGTKHSPLKVPRDAHTANFTTTAALLRAKLAELTAAGMHPFYVTLTMGTTSTVAVDAFAEIAAVKADYPHVWMHVDAAYAGAALVCPEYQPLLAGVAAFDSFDMNMHKWLLVNFDCSCFFVRERRHLLNALSITPSYLRNRFSESGRVTDYRDWQIPLGRRFRALKVWFVMRTYGVAGMRAHIRRTVRIGAAFADWVRARPDLFRIFAPPAFALTVFTVNDPREPEEGTTGGGEEERRKERENEITKDVYEAVNAAGDIWITSTVVDGTYAIRVCTGAPQVQEHYIRRAFEIIVGKAEEARAKVLEQGKKVAEKVNGNGHGVHAPDEGAHMSSGEVVDDIKGIE